VNKNEGFGLKKNIFGYRIYTDGGSGFNSLFLRNRFYLPD